MNNNQLLMFLSNEMLTKINIIMAAMNWDCGNKVWKSEFKSTNAISTFTDNSNKLVPGCLSKQGNNSRRK